MKRQACNEDGGDCSAFLEEYPDCNVDQPEKIGNGICDAYPYDTPQCKNDGGDCDYVDPYPDCHVSNKNKLGNNICDGGDFNTYSCGWDGGDCSVCNGIVQDHTNIGKFCILFFSYRRMVLWKPQDPEPMTHDLFNLPILVSFYR